MQKLWFSLADIGGECKSPCKDSDSFILTHHSFKKMTASGVGTPHEVGAPVWKVLDPPMVTGLVEQLCITTGTTFTSKQHNAYSTDTIKDIPSWSFLALSSFCVCTLPDMIFSLYNSLHISSCTTRLQKEKWIFMKSLRIILTQV